MQIFNKFKGTKGFITMWERVLRFRYMIQEDAKRKVKILAFWEKYGDEATKEAFGTGRSTLYRWQKELKEGHGKLEALNNQSRAPKNKRKRIIPESIEALIIKERTYDSQISKDKLAVLIQEDKLGTPSASTVGRMLTDLKKQGKLPERSNLSYYAKSDTWREKTLIKRKKLRSKGHTGGLVKADSIVRFTNGIRRYIVTAIDKETKFAFAYAYIHHSSDTATDFMKKFKDVAPLTLTHVQTDNGSEFALHFNVYLEKEGIVHFHTYPRTPKMNAEIERFNRTLSDAFIKSHRMTLAYDIETFNQKLIDWLLWYNTRRPHWSLGLVSPLRYIVSTLPEKSHMLWTSTKY